MDISGNKQSIVSVLDETAFYEELKRLLMMSIQSELEKDDIDCDLIEECTAAIEALEAELVTA